MSEPRDPPAEQDPTGQELAIAYLAFIIIAAEMRALEAQARLTAARVAWGEAMGLDDPGDGYEALWASSRVKGSGGAP